MRILALDAPDAARMIERIQCANASAALVLAGGGSGAIHALLCHPGASRLVLEVQVPYATLALSNYLGEEPEACCSADTARRLAMVALKRAELLNAGNHESIGVSCVAALQTRRARKGDDRAFVCVAATERKLERELRFEGGTRQEQEDAVSILVLNILAEFLAVDEALPLSEELCTIT